MGKNLTRDDEETALWGKIKLIIKEFSLNASTHGIPSVARSKLRCMKFMWLVFLLSAIVCCAYLIFKAITSYLSYDVVTTIRTFYQIPSDFPMVTVCSTNSLITPEAKNFSANILEPLMKQGMNLFDGKDPKFARFVVTMFASHPALSDEFRQSFTIPFNISLLACSFNMLKCDANDFEWTYDVVHGNCYKFNSGKNGLVKTATKNAKSNGLNVLLYLPPATGSYSFAAGLGANIYIGNQSELIPFDKGYSVPVGMQADVSIQRQFTYKQPYPYSDCSNDIESSASPLVKYFKKRGLTYKKNTCLDLCYQLQVVKKCGCYSLVYPNPDLTAKPCVDWISSRCALDLYNTFYSSSLVAGCIDYCPQECDAVTYPLTISYLDYPSQSCADYLYNVTHLPQVLEQELELNASQAELYRVLKQSIVAMNVYYEELSYVVIEESPKFELADLIANLGGVMGVALGMSFLSFCEFLEAFIEIIAAIVSHRFVQRDDKRRQVATSN